jgi:outer membrane murein-binding lipoprotein Lpp
MRNYFFPILLLFVLAAQTIFAQQEDKRLTAREFSIPASPVFDLMGVSPSLVSKTSDLKEFKVDWSFKNWKLNPNLAIQAQPVWEILYNRKSLKKYQEASLFMRRLSSLDVSIGTIQSENNDRRIGFSGRMNLYKQRDPLMAKDLYADIDERYKQEHDQLSEQLTQLNSKLDTVSNILEKPALRQQIQAIEDQLNSQNSRRIAEINGKAAVYAKEFWNASFIDVAFGKVFTYQTDSVGSLRKLRLDRNTGLAGWLNFGKGLGEKFLVSGLLRTTWYDEELSFLLEDQDGNQTTQTAVARNTLFSAGFNVRYGGPVFNFFAEFLYERKGILTASEALTKAFEAPNGQEVVAGTVKWGVVFPNNISFGGDWRISRSLVLNFGMRCVYDKNWNFQSFNPVATVSCLMR